MRATVNLEARFTVALLSHLLSHPFFGEGCRIIEVVAVKKQKATQVIDNIEFATVNLLSRAKSLKSLDATVKSP
jgi:hypothetical protein